MMEAQRVDEIECGIKAGKIDGVTQEHAEKISLEEEPPESGARDDVQDNKKPVERDPAIRQHSPEKGKH